MHVSRPFAAACAACVARVVTFPMDTVRVRSMLSNNTDTTALYDGVHFELVGSATSTYVYFQVYEANPVIPLLLRTTMAVICSGVVYTFFDVCKKRIQSKVDRRITLTILSVAYMLNICKRLPKTCVHYLFYESLFPAMKPHVGNGLAGGMSAALATAASTMLVFPIELLRMRVMLGHVSRQLRAPFAMSVSYSILGSCIGHALLEMLAPRLV